MSILKKIKSAGVVGAGGAGFPTHVKLDCQAEYLIASGAECEPLLRVDQQLMDIHAEEVVEGLSLSMKQVGAKNGIIFLKAHYHKAAEALQQQIKRKKNIRLHLCESYYPAGDEQQAIFEVTGRVVPPGGLPKDVGCVVINVATLADISRSVKDIPVTQRYITVAGAVKKPCTLRVPLGAPMETLVELAGGAATSNCAYIVGGPCMGELIDTLEGQVVTKTTSGLLVIPANHPLVAKKASEIRIKQMMSVCCQCNMCTLMCPRYALGQGTSPHKAMRSIISNTDLLGDVNSILTCCECGLCTYQACGMDLNPALIMKRMKKEMISAGLKANPSSAREPDRHIAYKRLSSSRLIARLGLKQYDLPAPIDPNTQRVLAVKIPLKMHIGAAAVPVVKSGELVTCEALIAQMPPGALGADIHASIDGTVTEVTEKYIEIRG